MRNIDEALRNTPRIEVPSSTLAKVDNVLADLDNRKVKTNIMKLKSFMPIAAVITICVILCGTALAANGIIDFGRFYNSIFSNPEAEPYVSTEDMISIIGNSDDLVIEPIAGFIDGDWKLYIQLKLTVQNGVPLPEALYILDGDHLINLGEVAITKVDERMAIISFRALNGRGNDRSEAISVKFDAISSEQYVIVGTSEDTITYFGDWEILISADNVIETRFVEGNFEGRSALVRIEATVVEVQVFGGEDSPYLTDSSGRINYSYDPEGTIKITLADGRVIEESMVESFADAVGNGNNDTFDEHGNRIYGMASYWCRLEFVNPADVISVELFGEPVFGPSGG